MFCKGLGILRTEELRVGREAYVNQAVCCLESGGRSRSDLISSCSSSIIFTRGSWMERCVLYRVPVYLSDIEVILYFGDLGGDDVVGGAPDAFIGCGKMLCENF
jgi:hypothetical protein